MERKKLSWKKLSQSVGFTLNQPLRNHETMETVHHKPKNSVFIPANPAFQHTHTNTHVWPSRPVPSIQYMLPSVLINPTSKATIHLSAPGSLPVITSSPRRLV